MEGLVLLESSYWYPLSYLGVTHTFFRIDAHTVTMTWLLLLFIALLIIAVRMIMRHETSLMCVLVIQITRIFMDFVTQTLKVFSFNHFSFACTLFTFIFLSSLLSLIPFLEEPTQNINTAFALGLSAFLYVQYYHIHAHGLKTYIKGFLSPFFIMLPLNVLSTCSTALSLSFRLFGNIFGGAIINGVIFGALGSLHRLFIGSFIMKLLASVLSLFGLGACVVAGMFFGLFEGMLQGFVFFMLTLTYLSLALEGVGH